MSYERMVELKRWPGIGFGFSVIGGSDTHIPPMICALVKDSPALLSKQIAVGDVLCKVNGISVTQYETKQVVDLIRNCKHTIVLSLREDRLAKLKARPFLTEGSLIDPPRAAKTPPSRGSPNLHQQISGMPHESPHTRHKIPDVYHRSSAAYQRSPRADRGHVQSSTNVNYVESSFVSKTPLTASLSYTNSVSVPIKTRPTYDRSVVGGPKTYEHGTDGRFLPKNHSIENLTLSDMSDQSVEYNDSYTQHSYIMQSPKIHNRLSPYLYKQEDLPLSPRLSYANKPNSSREVSYKHVPSNSVYNRDEYSFASYNSQVYGSNARPRNNYSTPHHVTDFTSAPHHNSQQFSTNSALDYQSHLQARNNSPYKKSESSYFEFEDGACASYIRQQSVEKMRPYSNPEFDNTHMANCPVDDPPVLNQLQHQVQNQEYRKQKSNFSSPNVFEEGDRISSEHKGLTLTPNTHSVHSLNKYYNAKDITFTERIPNLSPLSIHTPLSSYGDASSTASPLISTTSTGNTENTESPADIASRLFTLDGYKDTEIAPLLGKNSDFSQNICREYLQFFDFQGLSLDEAVRVFLNKFPFTGETQERERILIHFSKRFLECNKSSQMSEDAIHTLVCAIMLLNTDLHGQSISNKMSLNDFITNLAGLCDGGDFSKEYLKTLYHAIKSKEIIFASAKRDSESSPRHSKRKSSAPGNPFIELKIESNDAVLCEGYIYRKSVMAAGGRRTPAMKRSWRPHFCILKGLVLLSYKPDNVNSQEPHSIGIHHSLTGYAKDYKKRAYVFKLITADWSVYYIQAKNQDEVRTWMDSFNVSAALLSAPPLPAPVSSSMRFQRPVMPVSRTRLSLDEQVSHHETKVKTLEADLSSHNEYIPDPSNKHYQEWENKLDYLEFELKRFRAYVSVLTSKRLEKLRSKLLSARDKTTSFKPISAADKSKSASMHSLTGPPTLLSPRTQKRLYDENRQNYLLGPVSP